MSEFQSKPEASTSDVTIKPVGSSIPQIPYGAHTMHVPPLCCTQPLPCRLHTEVWAYAILFSRAVRLDFPDSWQLIQSRACEGTLSTPTKSKHRTSCAKMFL